MYQPTQTTKTKRLGFSQKLNIRVLAGKANSRSRNQQNTYICFSGMAYLRTIEKSMAILLCAALLFSTVVPVAQAANGHAPAYQEETTQPGNCAAPERAKKADPGTIFLPFISSLAGGLSASASDSATSDANIVQAPLARTLNYEAGKVYTYLYDYAITTQSMSRDKEAMRSEAPSVVRVNSYIDVTILSKAADGTADAHVVMREPFLCGTADEGQQIVAQDQKFLEQLATPLRFKQATNGVITEIMSLPELPSNVTNIQKGVINFLQMTLREDSNTYGAMETGGQGEYNANYKLEDKADGLHITKTIGTADYQALKSAGDQTQSLQLSTTLSVVIGGDRNVITSINVVEDHKSADGMDDPANTDATQGADGLSVWSTAKTTGSLMLEDVADAPADATVSASSLFALYTIDTIGGELDGDYSVDQRIDLSTIDLDAELAALEADDDNPQLFMGILELASADEATVVVDKLGARLQQVLDNDDLAMLYIDLLGTIGTPKAQEYLNGFFDNSGIQAANVAASSTITTQQQVLINMVTLTEPVSKTVETLRMVSNDDTSPLKPAAATVLGGLADNFHESDPDLQKEILGEVEESLFNAETVDDVLLYLDVLGNIGDDISVEVISDYISDPIEINGVVITDTIDIEDINVTAYEALRGVPVQEAEDLLVEGLQNEALQPWLRDIIAELLIDRDFEDETILTQEAADALDVYIDTYLDAWDDDYDTDEPEDPGEGEGLVSASGVREINGAYSRNWGKNFGNAYVGVRLPGSLYAATPPQSNAFGGGLYVRATQRVDAYVWQVLPNYNVASGSAEARFNGFSGYNINVNLSVLNNRLQLVNQNRFISCTQEIGPIPLLNKHISIFNKSVTIFVLGILPISFGVSAGGSLYLTVDAGTNNVCVGDFKAVRLRVTPAVSITIIGEAYVNLAFVQGGAALRGDLIKVGLPTQGRIEFTTSTGVQRWCVNVDVTVQPFFIRFYLFARARWNIFSNKWPVKKEWTVAQYGSASYKYPIYAFCQ